MNKLDKDALERALETLLTGKDRARANQIARLLQQDGWQPTAEFACHLLQSEVLRLRPWDRPPCSASTSDDSEAGKLLRRMLAAGLSRYDPNPLAVLQPQEAVQ